MLLCSMLEINDVVLYCIVLYCIVLYCIVYCSCSNFVQHAELTLCLPKNVKKVTFLLFASLVKLTQLINKIDGYINVFH